MRLKAYLLLLFLFHHAAYATDIACASISEVLARVQANPTGSLDAQLFRDLGFQIEEFQTFGQSIGIRISDEAWENSQGTIRRSMQGFQQETNNISSRGHPLGRPSRSEFQATDNGYSLNGNRFYRRNIDGENQYFEMEFREVIERNENGNVHHYISMNVYQLDEAGERSGQIFYADSPHLDRDGGKWIHVHDADSQVVLSQIDSQGYNQSALGDIHRWMSEYLTSN